jgi:HPt (histidine-containing phosphotransfer) domain-containing protein
MTDATIDEATFADLQAAAGEDFVKELIDTFFEEAPMMLSELRDAFASGNADKFRRAAHSLKSNSHTFGARSLGALARDLELKGLPPDAAPLDALDAEYARTAASLKGLRDA